MSQILQKHTYVQHRSCRLLHSNKLGILGEHSRPFLRFGVALHSARLRPQVQRKTSTARTFITNQTLQELSPYLIRELRSDHAGETGAVYIYRGITAIANLYRDQELIDFAKHHGETEAEHLRLIEDWLEPSARSRLLGAWRLAGWLTGALPALFGRRSVYATIAAVETFVDDHYQQQINYLQQNSGPAGLLPLLQRCQADEQQHRDEAARQLLEPMSWVLRIWCSVVGSGSAAAVVLARRI